MMRLSALTAILVGLVPLLASLECATADAEDPAALILAAEQHLERDELEPARAVYEKVLAIVRKTKSMRDEVEIRRWIVDIDMNLGDLRRTRDGLLAIGTLLEALDRKEELGETHADVGYVETQLGNYTRALRAFENAEDIARSLKNEGPKVRLLARIQARLSQPLLETGRLAEALRNAEDAARTFASPEFAKQKGGTDLAEALNEVGRIQLVLGQHAAAITTFASALSEAPEAAAPLRLRIRCNEAIALYELGDAEAVKPVFENALETFESHGDPEAARRARIQLGILALRMGRRPQAVDALRPVFEDEEAPELDRARAYVYAARAALEGGDPKQAIRWFGRGRALARSTDSKTMASAAAGGLARAYLARGGSAKDKILGYVREALHGVDELTSGLPPLALSTSRGHVDRASAFSTGIELALATDDAPLLYEMIERARAGALRLRARRPVGDPLPETHARVLAVRNSREQLTTARQRLDRATRRNRSVGELKEARSAVREAEGAHARALQRLAMHDSWAGGSKQQAPAQHIAPIGHVQSLLEEGEALVMYTLAGSRAGALVLTAKARRIVRLGKTVDVHNLLEASRDGRSTASDWLAALPDLRTKAVTPLGLSKRTKRVLLVPDGLLASVPSALLMPGIEVAFVPSATQFARLEASKTMAGKGILAFGDPEFARHVNGRALSIYAGRSSLLRLEGSGREVTHVARGKDAHKRTRAQASETEFRELATSRERWAALLLATHGFPHLEDPGRSALVLTPSSKDDGFLTVAELMSMRVAADVVFLSACDSGRGVAARNEGLLGLPHAFLYGGSRSVIASLWKVEDEATEHLVKAFFDAQKRGLGAAEALSKAQEAVRTARAEWQQPDDWAAWVIWGLPD